jgi:protein-tyrosine phosphatase
MKKVLMVCLGNICRSPMAEGIFTEVFNQRNIDVQFDSAGTAAYHVSEPPDDRAQAELQKNGIDISHQRAQKFILKHFEEYDLIFAMDHSNFSDIVYLAKEEKHRNKVELVMNLAYPNKNITVPDPYYGGDEGFSQVYAMLYEAAQKLADKWEENNK